MASAIFVFLAATSAEAASLTGSVQVTIPTVQPERMLYQVSFSDGANSFAMTTRYDQGVVVSSYSPVVYNGFGGSCALPVDITPGGLASTGCNWDTSRNYHFEYWTPGFFGAPAPIQLSITTPLGFINYGGVNPTPELFHFAVQLRFVGGPAALPAVAGPGGTVSNVADLPVSFILDIAVLRSSQVLPGDLWWLTSGDCLWCGSYFGTGLAAGSATLSLSTQTNSRAYSLSGDPVPEPSTLVLSLLGVGALLYWGKRRNLGVAAQYGETAQLQRPGLGR